MLAYSGVAHAGFIMTGVVGGGWDGVLFYVSIYAVQLVGAFAVVTAVSGPGGSASSLSEYRGLARRSPGLAAGFTVLLLGMAGLPLTAGFIAKFGVFTDAWSRGLSWLVVVAVLASVIALAFYLRVIVIMYMEDEEGGALSVPATVRAVLGVAVIATVLWGLFPGSLLDLAANAFPL
jgi:NADH-quinone oxidoreductase subunit N